MLTKETVTNFLKVIFLAIKGVNQRGNESLTLLCTLVSKIVGRKKKEKNFVRNVSASNKK